MVNPVLAVFYRIKDEAKIRRLKRAIRLLEAEGLSVVRLKTIGDKQYIQSKTGSFIRVGKR